VSGLLFETGWAPFETALAVRVFGPWSSGATKVDGTAARPVSVRISAGSAALDQIPHGVAARVGRTVFFVVIRLSKIPNECKVVGATPGGYGRVTLDLSKDPSSDLHVSTM
jgi:hypothetical protein